MPRKRKRPKLPVASSEADVFAWERYREILSPESIFQDLNAERNKVLSQEPADEATKESREEHLRRLDRAIADCLGKMGKTLGGKRRTLHRLAGRAANHDYSWKGLDKDEIVR